MEHYICKGGCKGVSETPGVCQALDCPHYGRPLEKCACEDNGHYGVFQEAEKEKTEEKGAEGAVHE